MARSENGARSDIPFPIVALNRAVIVVRVVVVALVFRQLWVTTLLFIVLAAAVLFGPRRSLIFRVGQRILRGPISMAVASGNTEAPVLMRFNNSLAVIILALAQLSFLLGWAGRRRAGYSSGWWRWPRRSPWPGSASAATSSRVSG